MYGSSPLSQFSFAQNSWEIAPNPYGSSSSSAPPADDRMTEEPAIVRTLEEKPPRLFRDLIEQLHQLARFPRSVNEEQLARLSSQLNEALQAEPCFQLDQYQIRILQLKEMLKDAQGLSGSERLLDALNQHLIHAEQAATALYLHSFTPVQDSFWRLYERILQLPSLKPDLFGAAIAMLHEQLPYAIQDDPLIERLRGLLPELQPPACYFRSQPDSTESLKRIEEVKQTCVTLLHHLQGRSSESRVKVFCAPLKSILGIYRSFLDEFSKASEGKRRELLTPQAQLSGVGLGFFSLDQSEARDLLSRDEKGNICKKNKDGIHAVCHKQGVYYKPNPEGMFYIGPEMEFAVYAFYQLLGCQGVAPTALAKVRNVFFAEEPNPYERVLQASYGIQGMCLRELLGMANVLPFLESCLGIDLSREAFLWFVGEEWQREFFENYPHLSQEALSSLNLEEAAERLVNAYEAHFNTQPAFKRCLEFLDRPSADQTKRDFCVHISRYSTGLLVDALALLIQYPDLVVISAKKKLRGVSFTELTDLCFHAQKAKQYFPKLSAQQLLSELPKLMSRFDPVNFSAHFVVSLLTNPCDHKTDNIMVTLERDERDGVQSLSLVGIDNDLAFAPNENAVRTILYLLDQPMHRPFDSSIAQKLLETTPEAFVFDWLVALEEQNQRYMRWQRQGVLTEGDLCEGGLEALHIPLKIETGLVLSIYKKVQALTAKLKEDPDSTHRDLLQAIQPELNKVCQQALSITDTPEMAYGEVPRLFSTKEEPRAIRIEKQILAEAALSFLQGLQLCSFPLKLQVSLMGKALRAFPHLVHSLTTPGGPGDPFSRCEFFLMAVKQGHTALVGRLLEEEKRHYLEHKEIEVSLIETRNPEEQTALLLACLTLDLEMIKLLVHYRADLQALDLGGRSALSLCLQHFRKSPTETAEAVRFLGEQPNILFNLAAGRRGWGSLHHLVSVAEAAPEQAEPLLAYLIRKGATSDLLDDQNRTPLDYAIEQQNERLVQQLIQQGAGRTLDVEAARAFFASRPNLEKFYVLLKSHSLLLRWHLALDALRSSSTDSQVTLKEVQLGEVSLPPNLTKHLLDNHGDIVSQLNYGRRNVGKLTLPGGHELFFKQYPEMPGIEYAVDKLFEWLIGHGTSFTDFVRLTLPRGRSYPVLISQAIQGDNLQDVLQDPVKTRRLEKLDPLAFSELLLASMLVNFEDAKPDNFILEPQPEGTYRLVGIDNDHAFVPPLVREGDAVALVKCILYCLDQANHPIHPAARERFLSFSPERLLRLWLEQLERQNQHYCNLFSSKERRTLFKKSGKNSGMVIPIPFRPGYLVDIYQKFQRLQIALKESAQLTGMEALRLVIPQLGIRYEEAFRTHKTPLERFLSITKTQYCEAVAGRRQSINGSHEIIRLMTIPEKALHQEVFEYGPTLALRELKAIQQEIEIRAEQLSRIRQALQEGDPAPFNQLKLDTSKEKVINGLPGAFEGIDFGAMQHQGLPDLAKQKRLLGEILKGNYRTLCLSGCAALDRAFLTQILFNSPLLLKLELRACQVDNWLLTQLSQAQHLSHLCLANLPEITQLQLPHPTLYRLQILLCPKLQQLTISHTLKHLSVEACWTLSSIDVKLYEGATFYRWYPRLVGPAPSDFVLQTLRLKACPQLQPWWGMFADWLKASTSHCIQLRDVPPRPVITEQGLSTQEEGLLVQAILRCPEAMEMLLGLKAWCLGEDRLVSLALDYFMGKPLSCGKGLTNVELGMLANCCPQLTNISLSGCYRITDSGLDTLARGCPQLSSLDLAQCKQITNIGLDALVRGCPKLSSLDLSQCKQITGSGITALLKGCPNLANLNLWGCDQIKDNELITLAQSRPNLSSLDLSWCTQITDIGLRALAEGCPNLSSLNLSHCAKITHGALHALAQGCPHLSSLDLSLCSRITDIGLSALLAAHPRITVIR